MESDELAIAQARTHALAVATERLAAARERNAAAILAEAAALAELARVRAETAHLAAPRKPPAKTESHHANGREPLRPAANTRAASS